MNLKMRKLGILAGAMSGMLLLAAALWAASRTLTVTVVADPPTCNLTCAHHDPRGLPEGYCNGREASLSGIAPGHIQITWSTNGADSVSLDGAAVGASGSVTVAISQSEWRAFPLSASNAVGSCSATVYGRTSCFLKGTEILMSDGSYKKIEEIGIGETVMAWDIDSGKLTPVKVTQTVQASTSRYYVLNDNLKISIGHQIWANGQWTWSENLKVGDKLFDAGGNEITISSLQTVDETVEVFNLITDPLHNFFAGTQRESYLVHNKNRIQDHANKGLLKGMEVIMADGRRLPVERVKLGDKILTYDFERKRYAIGTVRDKDSQKVKGYMVINGSLKVAKGHPFYAAPKAKKAKKVKK